MVGFLGIGDSRTMSSFVEAFKVGLADAGYADGQNVRIDYRWAENRLDRLPGIAGEFAASGVSVIVASGGSISAVAARKATLKIPIVFTGVGDAVGLGIVESLAKPGGNATGFSVIADDLNVKRLELLNELVADDAVLGILLNQKNPSASIQSARLQGSAQVLGRRVAFRYAASEEQLIGELAAFRRDGIAGLVVGADPFFTSLRDLIVATAAEYRMPAIYQWREFVEAGGLVSYGTSLPDSYRQSGIYVGRILNGASPGDLPVVQPTMFELVVNLHTAQALGIALPKSFQFRATEILQ